MKNQDQNPSTTRNSMGINYDKLAKGLLETFSAEDKAVIAFGMIPHDKFQWFMGLMYDEIARKLTKEGGKYEYFTYEEVRENLSKETKSKIEHEMSLALYRNAKMVV